MTKCCSTSDPPILRICFVIYSDLCIYFMAFKYGSAPSTFCQSLLSTSVWKNHNTTILSAFCKMEEIHLLLPNKHWSHQESEPNLNTRKGQQDSSRKKKTLYDHCRTQKAAHCRWHTLPARRFLRFAFFFLSRCCLPACLRTILPLPVTENLFADACHFPNPRGDWPSGTWWPKFRSPWSMWRPKLTHFLHFQVCSPDWLRHL